MFRSLKEHWPEYFCEAAELGLFMISAALFTMLLWHPSSPVFNLIPNTFVRRMLTGIAMGSTVLVIDDDPVMRRLVRRILEREGYEAEEISSAEELDAALAQRVPDLIVSDVLMPGYDGVAVCRRLRA